MDAPLKQTEEWKWIDGYENYYQVSNLGRVKSVDREVFYKDGRKAIHKGGPVAINTRPNGYLKANLYKDGKMKNVTIHRLVAEAFIPNPNNYPVINHKDENKANNYVENLEWCTYKYNSNYGTAKERWASKQSIPVKGVHIETGKEIYLKSMAEGALYGFDQRAISAVCLGEYKTHRGYSFQKIEKVELNETYSI